MTQELTSRAGEQSSQFEFDQVFAPKVGQSDVFSEVEPLVLSVMDGYNVCIFAYGQTGSLPVTSFLESHTWMGTG